MEREELVSSDDIAQGLGPRANVGATVFGLQPDAEGDVIGHEQWKAIHERRAAGKTVSAIARGSSTWIARPCEVACGRQPGRRIDGKPALLPCSTPTGRGSSSGTPGQLLGAHPTPGTAQPAASRAVTKPSSSRFARCAQKRVLPASRNAGSKRVRANKPRSTMGQVTRIVRRTAQQGPYLRIDPRLQPPGLRRRLHERAHSRPAGCPWRAFACFGGRCGSCSTIACAPSSSAMTTDEHGERKAKFNATFAAFADHWGFTPRLCRPYRAQTRARSSPA